MNNMPTQKLMSNFIGNKVEVTIETPRDCDKTYTSVPFSILDDFAEKIECGSNQGNFTDLPDDELSTGDQGYMLSGSWRIIVIDYEKICRILSWEYNFSQSEVLTEDIFVRYFGGVMGRHYYDKWMNLYQNNLHDMLVYFGNSRNEGQLFCDMLVEQMLKYEQRKSNQKDGKQ